MTVLSAPRQMQTTPDVTTRKLKVVSIAHSAVNRASGRIRYEKLIECRDDIDLTLVAPDRWHEYGKMMPLDAHSGAMDFRVERVRLPHVPGAGWYLHHYPGLKALLTRLQPDVIHLWEEPWSMVAWQAIRLRDRLMPNAAIMLETDQNILRRLPQPFEQVRRRNLARTDLLIGRQPESLDVARSCGFDGPTAIVEYGVASNIFAQHDRDGARATLGVSGFVIGYVGRIVREKGLHDVLDAMVACAVPVTLLILGDGPDRPALEARVAELGLGQQVRLLSPRPPAEVARVMNALDVLILMSRTARTWKEQFGRVIMEAQACGVPVIGSDSGSIPGVVASGGWIVPEGDAVALAKLIERLAAHPEALASARAAGLAQAANRFAISTVANALGDAFVTAAAARRAMRHIEATEAA
jgi:glycosyltransferase involved in cell wall biosynthesis